MRATLVRATVWSAVAAALIGPSVAGTTTQRPASEKVEPCRPSRWSWSMPESETPQKPPRSGPNDTAQEVIRIVAPLGINLSSDFIVDLKADTDFHNLWRDSRFVDDLRRSSGEIPRIPEARVAFLRRHAGDLARLRELLSRKRDPQWESAPFSLERFRTVLVTDAFLALRDGDTATAIADIDAALIFVEAFDSGQNVFMDPGGRGLSLIASALRFMPVARPCPWAERLRRIDRRKALLRTMEGFTEGFETVDSFPWEDGAVLKAALAEGLRPYLRTCAGNAAELWHAQVVSLSASGGLCISGPSEFRTRLMDSIPSWNRIAPRLFRPNVDAAEKLMEAVARIEWEIELTERVLELREFGRDPARRGTLPSPVPSDACTGSSWVFTRVDGGRAVETALQPEPAFPEGMDWAGRFRLSWPPE